MSAVLSAGAKNKKAFGSERTFRDQEHMTCMYVVLYATSGPAYLNLTLKHFSVNLIFPCTAEPMNPTI